MPKKHRENVCSQNSKEEFGCQRQVKDELLKEKYQDEQPNINAQTDENLGIPSTYHLLDPAFAPSLSTILPTHMGSTILHDERKKIVVHVQHSFLSFLASLYPQLQRHSHAMELSFAKADKNECAPCACPAVHIHHLEQRKKRQLNEKWISCW